MRERPVLTCFKIMVFRTPNVKLDKAQLKIITFKLKYLLIYKVCLINATYELY